ncbi:protein PBDC1 isoform X1 [Anabrus simplex]|uniref:protein PBDC1 isoform X1 n=1 Tax=Anabrus simplex TaxID=316456 RepID=UPI0034DD73E6
MKNKNKNDRRLLDPHGGICSSSMTEELGAQELLAGASLLSRPAEEFGNDPNLEAMWAMKAYEHAEVYFNILCSVDPKLLRLSPHDDTIYKTFRETFPDLKIDILNEEDFKSEEAKKKWRHFCEKFNGVIEDYNFGTLLRLDHSGEYSASNSILVTRIQFYAIEVARNKEGLNSGLRAKYKPKAD